MHFVDLDAEKVLDQWEDRADVPAQQSRNGGEVTGYVVLGQTNATVDPLLVAKAANTCGPVVRTTPLLGPQSVASYLASSRVA